MGLGETERAHQVRPLLSSIWQPFLFCPGSQQRQRQCYSLSLYECSRYKHCFQDPGSIHGFKTATYMSKQSKCLIA
jgi:hypothetical protein